MAVARVNGRASSNTWSRCSGWPLTASAGRPPTEPAQARGIEPAQARGIELASAPTCSGDVDSRWAWRRTGEWRPARGSGGGLRRQGLGHARGDGLRLRHGGEPRNRGQSDRAGDDDGPGRRARRGVADRRGRLAEPSLTRYPLPRFSDAPEIEVVPRDPLVPWAPSPLMTLRRRPRARARPRPRPPRGSGPWARAGRPG